MESEEFMVNPQQLLSEAQQEPRRRGLEDYREAIRVLKEEKDFTLREVASWLQQRGVNVDHNAVWRAYSKGTPEGLIRRATQRNERVARQQGHEEAMPWLKEP